MAKKVIVTREGLTNCPSCLSHIALDETVSQTACPFCGEALQHAHRMNDETFGAGVMQVLKNSRSSMLAAALGASLTMTACGGGNNDSNAVAVYGAPPMQDMDMDSADDGASDMEVKEDDGGGMALYGGPPVEDMQGLEDTGGPAPLYGAVPVDMSEDMEVDMPEDLGMPVPEYGAPPEDMG